MTHGNGRVRTAVRCLGCESVYPGWRWPDGTVRIIGREGCGCGETDLEALEDPEFT